MKILHTSNDCGSKAFVRESLVHSRAFLDVSRRSLLELVVFR